MANSTSDYQLKDSVHSWNGNMLEGCLNCRHFPLNTTTSLRIKGRADSAFNDSYNGPQSLEAYAVAELRSKGLAGYNDWTDKKRYSQRTPEQLVKPKAKRQLTAEATKKREAGKTGPGTLEKYVDTVSRLKPLQILYRTEEEMAPGEKLLLKGLRDYILYRRSKGADEG